MSRTWKKYTGNCYRGPRGKRQALIAGVERKGAIPPDSWDDLRFDKHVDISFKVAAGMARRGDDWEVIVRHLMKKFGMRRSDAEWCVESGFWKKYWERRRMPEGLMVVMKEKELK